LTTDVHERMDQLVEAIGCPRESNDESRAIKVFVSEVEEGHNAFTKHILAGTISVDIQRFWLSREIKNKALPG